MSTGRTTSNKALYDMAGVILAQFTEEELDAFRREEGVPCLCWDCVIFGNGIAEKLFDRLEAKAGKAKE